MKSLWRTAFVLCISAPAVHGAPMPLPDVHRLSEGVDRAVADMAKEGASATTVIVLDRSDLDRNDLQDLMFALLDRRQAGARTIAVAATKGANGCIALACGSCTFVADASIRGLDADAISSGSQRERLAMDIAALGGVEPELATALVDPSDALYWENGRFSATTSGATAIRLATAGRGIELDQTTLNLIGLRAGMHDTVEGAIRAAQSGALPPLVDPSVLAARGNGGAPRGNGIPPSRPSVPPGGTVPSNPSKPSSPSSPPPLAGPTTTTTTSSATDGVDPETAKKIAPKMKEYAETLATLKTDIKEFNELFTGRTGIWTSRNKGLKQVWLDSAEQTKDKNTALACSRLQRDIKTSIQKLESAVNTIGRIIKDNAHPEVVRLSRNKLVLDALRAAIERNRAADYEKASADTLKLVP